MITKNKQRKSNGETVFVCFLKTIKICIKKDKAINISCVVVPVIIS